MSQRKKCTFNKNLRIEFCFSFSRKVIMTMYKMLIDIYAISWYHVKITKLAKIRGDISAEEELESPLIVRRYFREPVSDDGDLPQAAVHCETSHFLFKRNDSFF